MQPLDGIKVLDLTQAMAGPFCTMKLGDMGADVIKIEKPHIGDDARHMGRPFIIGESAAFLSVNRNKRSMTLNLRSEQGVSVFHKLATTADIIIENYRPGVVDRLGIGYETINKINPKIIYCSISGYGQTGPYKNKGGFDIIAQSASGIMSVTGEKGRQPVKAGIAVSDAVSGITATYAILAALFARERSGVGQYLETSLVESALSLCLWESAYYFATKEIPKPLGSTHRIAAPYQAFQSKDGYIIIGAANQKLWEALTAVLERPELLDDTRFSTNGERVKHKEELQKIIESVLKVQPSHIWLEKLDAAGIPSGPINTFDKILEDPHILERDMVVEFQDPTAGLIKSVGDPVKFSKTPGMMKKTPPLLGEHTHEILQEIGFSIVEIRDMEEKRIL